MPVIKREESLEPPIASIASAVSFRATLCSSKAANSWFQRDNAVDVKPSLQPPQVTESYMVAKPAHLSPVSYGDSSRSQYIISDVNDGKCPSTVVKPQFRPSLEPPFASAIATARVNMTTTTARPTSCKGATPSNIRYPTRPSRSLKTTHAENRQMNGNIYGNATDKDGNAAISTYPPLVLNDDDPVLISRQALDDVQYHVQFLQNAHAASVEKGATGATTKSAKPLSPIKSNQVLSIPLIFTVREQEGIIRELVTFNHRIHMTIQDFHQRLSKVEAVRAPSYSYASPAPAPGDRADADGRSRSPSPTDQDYRDREATLSSRKLRGRKQLHIQLPGKMYQPAGVGLPTPSTSFMCTERLPKTPLTPGRIGPPGNTKRTSTCINKRGIHNLDKMVPPAYAQLPLLPITDTELIVYFFNALVRPVVALRLYARGWGPLQICEALNSHRSVVPAYLRNTCSVKCTTAIKKGREKYGDQWESTTRIVFEDRVRCTDDKATDMIRLGPDEVHMAVDFDIRDLCNGLKKHPNEQDGGIFTHCVKYCQKHDADYKLSNVWELASDLDAGRTPRRIVSNTSTSSAGSTESAVSSLGALTRDVDQVEEGKDKDELIGSRALSEASDDSVMGGNAEISL